MSNSQPVIRSISLPSREHPCSVRIESLLKTLKSFLSFSPESKLNTVQTSLVALTELYACVDEFINTSTQSQAKPALERALDDSIALIDTCNVAREAFMASDEHIQTIQMALRRRGFSAEVKINAYLRYRKKAKNGNIRKYLRELKRLESQSNNNNNNVAVNSSEFMECVLRETSSITASVFRCLLKLLSSQSSTSRSGWSLVKKVLSFERDQLYDNNDNDDVEACLYSLIGNMESNEAVRVAQTALETMSLGSENLISGLDSMFRCLVKNRVSLLNVLTGF